MLKDLAPFLLQGALMTVDEFYCHRRRVLRPWERLGHPVDTLVFGLCLLFLYFSDVDKSNLRIYVGLSVFSCLLITKDEWQHGELCTGFENWLHAVLFLLHPVVLGWAGFLWWTGAREFLFLVLVMVFGFFVYQILYWNVWRRD